MYKYYVKNSEVEVLERYTHTTLVRYKNGKESSVKSSFVKRKKIKPQKENNLKLFGMEITEEMIGKHKDIIKFNDFAFNFTDNDLLYIFDMLGKSTNSREFFIEIYTGKQFIAKGYRPFMFYSFFNELSYENKIRVSEWINSNFKTN